MNCFLKINYFSFLHFVLLHWLGKCFSIALACICTSEFNGTLEVCSFGLVVWSMCLKLCELCSEQAQSGTGSVHEELCWTIYGVPHRCHIWSTAFLWNVCGAYRMLALMTSIMSKATIFKTKTGSNLAIHCGMYGCHPSFDKVAIMKHYCNECIQ